MRQSSAQPRCNAHLTSGCSHSTPSLPLPRSSFCPAPAVLLPSSFQAPTQLISSSSPVPAQLLPSFCPVLLYSAQLCSCPIPAQLLPCKCLSTAPALLQPCSCPAPRPSNPNFAAFIISTFTFFSTAVSNGFQILKNRFSMKKNP